MSLSLLPSHDDYHDAEAPIQDFYNFIETSLEGVEKNRRFLPSNNLEDYFTNNACFNLRNILSVVYNEDDQAPVGAKEIIDNGVTVIFGILLFIGKPRYIREFIRKSFDDNKLAFESLTALEQFPRSAQDAQFYEHFCTSQWRFCPARMKNSFNRVLDERYILPLRSKERLERGSSGIIYKIELHPMYNELPAAENTFALKTYHRNHAAELYQIESTIFMKIQREGRNPPNIVRCYGGFQHGNDYSIILEYADKGPLQNFLATTRQPATSLEVAKLWNSCFGMLRGLQDLHSNPLEIMWHQDIKPANILVFSTGDNNSSVFDCIMKLADFGTGHAKKTTYIDGEEVITDRDTQGTRTYGPPETSRYGGPLGRGPLRVPVKVDVWSLGCILSEIAVWAVLGAAEVESYARDRTKEIQHTLGLQDGDCFHNGQTVLRSVGIWHEKIRIGVPAHDVTTLKVLQLVEQMLLPIHERPEAQILCKEASSIWLHSLRAAKAISNTETAEYVEIMEKMTDLFISSRHNSEAGITANTEEPIRPGPSVLPATTATIADFRHHGSSNSSPENLTALGLIAVDDRESDGPSTRGLSSSTRENRVMSAPPYTSGNSSQVVNMALMPANYAELDSNARATMQYPVQPLPQNFTSPTNTDNIFPHDYANMSPSVGRVDSRRPSTALPLQPRQERDASRRPAPARQPSGDEMNLGEATEWMKECKTIKSKTLVKLGLPGPRLRGEEKLLELRKRDSIIIIDNSASMAAHKFDLTNLLRTFVYTIKRSDDDGLDLFFSQDLSSHHGYNAKRLVSCVKNKPFVGECDLSRILEQRIEEYSKTLKRTHQNPHFPAVPGLNVYIFTDAVWTRSCNVVPAIDSMVDVLKSFGKFEKQIGIQFISFGEDLEGLARLDLLDNGLNLDFDIVDTKPSKGCLYKMILGAINKELDDIDIVSPITPHQDPRPLSPNLSEYYTSQTIFPTPLR